MLKPHFLMDSILTQIALPAFGFCFRRSRFLVGGRRWVPNQKVEEEKAETLPPAQADSAVFSPVNLCFHW
jgi:hypothetical protein